MAPLVPFMISPEFDLVIAVLLGAGFGFVLEQAGFSSTRKLVGLFYGYDFTVLKVFFTAGVTAMTGILVLGHLGALDTSAIYVNPTFLWSALIGGLIMGVGFILGGFCPGTSLCAAAVGRIDAMLFIGGALVGILGFTEFYEQLRPLYMAEAMGNITMASVLGIPAPVFGLLLAIVAIAAFIGTSWIQSNVRSEPFTLNPVHRKYYVLAGLTPILLLLLVWITPSHQQQILNHVEANYTAENPGKHRMVTDHLAYELMNHAHDYNIIHVHDSDALPDTLRSGVPGATYVHYRELLQPHYIPLLRSRYKNLIFVADDPELARKGATMALRIGAEHASWLNVGVSEFRQSIFEVPDPRQLTSKAERDRERFRVMAARTLLEIEDRLKHMAQPIKREPVEPSGGC